MIYNSPIICLIELGESAFCPCEGSLSDTETVNMTNPISPFWDLDL